MEKKKTLEGNERSGVDVFFLVLSTTDQGRGAITARFGYYLG